MNHEDQDQDEAKIEIKTTHDMHVLNLKDKTRHEKTKDLINGDTKDKI